MKKQKDVINTCKEEGLRQHANDLQNNKKEICLYLFHLYDISKTK